jgi:hypothetical protein
MVAKLAAEGPLVALSREQFSIFVIRISLRSK